ncbi:hypothetical protein UFOVP1610_3 [uncultured Caudovirales phage]|uniref:Uncharacterized protein n=1 Tax=uncultured Caudovirales phage TaxID=2100421 RepID=A0A6J5SRE4_9CAUD|nr:hypothetical protein UFOVP1610_3 [uncultured Caudovirales phage]
MAELNFNALARPGPRGFMQGYEQGQQQRMAQETNQIAQDTSRFKLEELKRDREEAMQLQTQLKGMGHNGDLNAFFDEIAKTGKPEYVQMALEGKQKLKDLDAYAKLGSGGAPAPVAAPAQPMMRMPVAAAPASALGSGTFGMEPPTNALAAPAPAPTNALAPQPGADQIAPTQQRIRQLLDFARTNPRMAKQAMDEAKILQDQLELYSKRGQNEPPDAVMMQRLGYPLTPQGYQLYRDAQRQERMLSPLEEEQRIRIALASRPPAQPAQPVAPTITQIVDPTNPNQMITIDARRYQGGGVGTPGVLGVGGKEPGAALRMNKAEAGKTQLADDLDNLRTSFQTLDNLRAIPSTQRNAISNVTSALASTRAGQLTGQAFATEAQVERDVINSARSRLVNSIKNATGMSAQQLNSNVELQTMLKSISDPGQSYQSAIRIIGDIEDAYVKGSGQLPKSGRVAPETQGTGGFKYLGKEGK